MPSATANVLTDRAGRYLAQLGKHGGQMSLRAFHRPHRHNGGEASPKVVNSEWSDTDAVIDFGWGCCTLHATETALILRAEAVDTEHLHRVQDGIGARLQRIGRRDHLAVTGQEAHSG